MYEFSFGEGLCHYEIILGVCTWPAWIFKNQ